VDEHDDWDIVSGVGITALAVAAMRAMESTRDDALIDDPYAESFVTRSGATVPMPTSWADIDDSENRSEADKRWANFWTVTASYLGVRSRFFDEYFLDASTAGVRQVVILAAGLDTRAFRLSWPARVELFEIDQPKVLEFKDSVLEGQGALAGCARHIVPIDLRTDWPDALLRANFDPERPTAWLAEGLLVYLPGTAMEALFTHVHQLSAAGSWFATDEAVPERRNSLHHPAYQEVQRRLGLDLAALWPDDDRPDSGRWFGDHDWQVTAISRVQAADRYGRTLGEFAGDIFAGDIMKGTLLTARLT
jgi:methyltransferase (TIGR00027 family)